MFYRTSLVTLVLTVLVAAQIGAAHAPVSQPHRVPVHATPTPVPQLPSPADVHYTTDVYECSGHHGSSGQCEKLKRGDEIALYWGWKCSANCAIVHYHVWLSGKKHQLVATPGFPIALIREPRRGWSGACYDVTAFATYLTPATQSKPSSHICVSKTYDVVSENAISSRGYGKEYSILYGNSQIVQTLPPRSGGDIEVGAVFVPDSGQSQTNTYQRAAFEFDFKAVGRHSILGGDFAYDQGANPNAVCSGIYRAPAGWKTASWALPVGNALANSWGVYKGVMEEPIDSFLRKWNKSKRLVLFLEEANGVGTAEVAQSGVAAYSLTCQVILIHPRLLLKVGTTV